MSRMVVTNWVLITFVLATLIGVVSHTPMSLVERCAYMEEQGYAITPECQTVADAYNEKYGQ